MIDKVLLEMKDITKEFPGVKALDGINLKVKSGEVHALLGENGAGKSTLIKVLGGIYLPDGGEIYIEGEKVEINSVQDAQAQGVAIIHQEIVLVKEMTVSENIFLGREPKKNGMVDFAKMEADTQKLLDDLRLNITPWDIVGSLTIAQQQMVEIAKAVSQQSKILVMDEPTSSISDNEVEILFAIVKELSSRGVGIIYISHKMAELYQICDSVTVLRDGKSVLTEDLNKASYNELIRAMVGREITNFYTRTYNEPGDVYLEVENLGNNLLSDNVSFNVRSGEIVGFAGLVGSGRSEIVETVFGLRPKTNGRVLIKGSEIKISSPTDAVKAGLALVPEERHKDGLYLNQSVKFNTTIQELRQFLTGGKYNRKVENEIASHYNEVMLTKTPTLNQIIEKLSGGNQQKVLIGRWLATKPDILILDEPTRGVDVGAKSEIYSIINDLAKEGIAIIIISSELPEIINMSDRIYVMRQGEISGMLSREEASQEKIMELAAN